jgi:peptidoglycan/LPS O-acetylase OafA/YrhL
MVQMSFSGNSPLKKIEIIDLVRSFAILSVLGYHLAGSHLVSPSNLPQWVQWVWSKIAYNGSLGVSAFFVISGFLITRLIAQGSGGLEKPGLRAFYSRRIGRIVPLYLLVVLTGLFLLFGLPFLNSNAFNDTLQVGRGPLQPLFWISVFSFTVNWYVTFFDALNPVGGAWGILWTISIEEQFYLFYPLLLGVIKNKRQLTLGLGFFIVFGLLTRFINVWFYPQVISYNSFQSFDQIAMGCLLYLASDQWGAFLRKQKALCLILLISGVCLATLTYTHVPIRPELLWAIGNRFFFSSGIFLMLLGCLHQNWFEGTLSHLLSLPGRMSYGIYMIHVLVLYLLWDLLRDQNFLWVLGVFTVITLSIAYVSYRFFEMPMNQFIRKTLNPSGLK